MCNDNRESKGWSTTITQHQNNAAHDSSISFASLSSASETTIRSGTDTGSISLGSLPSKSSKSSTSSRLASSRTLSSLLSSDLHASERSFDSVIDLNGSGSTFASYSHKRPQLGKSLVPEAESCESARIAGQRLIGTVSSSDANEDHQISTSSFGTAISIFEDFSHGTLSPRKQLLH